MVFLELESVSKAYPLSDGSSVAALDSVNLKVRKGELITIVGPNGCGKSTLLKLIAGFEKPSGGQIRLRGAVHDLASTYLVSQNPNDSLFGWMTVRQNLFLDSARFSSKNSSDLFRSLLSVRIGGKEFGGLLDRFPYQLSGGQKQLVVIGRALLLKPSVLLLDEPFASLDFLTQDQIQQALLLLWSRTLQTVLFVSHQLEEAAFLSDKIVVFSPQPGSVVSVIENPLSRPRKPVLRLSPEFQCVKTRVLDALRGIE